MKYIDTDKLKNELESIYDNMLKRIKIDKDNSDYWGGKADAYRNVIVTLETLSEEPDKSLGEAAHNYAWEKQEHHIDFDGDEYLDYGPRYDAFIAGAKWQAEQDDRDVVFWKGMQHAIEGMKEDAVDGIYTKSMDGKNVFVESGALKIDPASVKVGDPVKLIIIKDDGKSD